jgi:FADH2 O2-dependent halogenase
LFGSEPWREAPYPVEDAAVHHVFDGGWIWVLHFGNGITSAGTAVTDRAASQLRLSDGQQGWERLLQRLPVLREQFADAHTVQPFRHTAQLGFRSAAISGSNWALLPSAAGFVDPLLSTGFPLTLLGVTRLAKIIECDWNTEAFAEKLESYALKTDTELLATSRLIGALYANMGNFRVFAALSLIYFAVASYAEAATRLGKRQLAQSFLLHDQPQFGPECAQLLDRARQIRTQQESGNLIEQIYRLIEPFDIAGLRRGDRLSWYPVEAEDLLHSGYKLGASREEIMRMLERCGFQPATLQV